MDKVRPPAVAGTFYPANAGRLRAMVEDHLAGANGTARTPPDRMPPDRMPPDRMPKALIAPHAGYVYSGRTAGHAFAALGAGALQIRRVVVIGPAHFVPFRGIAVPGAQAFRTPLGDVPLDSEAIAALRALPQVVLSDVPHQPEHALEVELPFLQTVLGAFALVPLVVGDSTPAEVAEVVDRLWGGPETLLVISSDLSHYEAYGRAQQRDAVTAAAIERLDGAALGPRDACGHLAVSGLLIEALRRGLGVQRLELCNSGDTAGPRDSVVGYGAWAFTA